MGDDIDTRLLVYMLAMQMAVWIAGPFFTPYMFVQLKLSYVEFMTLTCAAFLSKALFLPALGNTCDRVSPRTLLWISGALIAPLPALWLLFDSYLYLLVLQLISGAIWAAYELAMLLLFFETIPKAKRLAILTAFNLASAAATAVASVFGGAVLVFSRSCPEAYVALFVFSSLARVAALGFLIRAPEVKLRSWLMATRPVAVGHSVVAVERPVLPGTERATQLAMRSEGRCFWSIWNRCPNSSRLALSRCRCVEMPRPESDFAA
jgi:MFS family permease